MVDMADRSDPVIPPLRLLYQDEGLVAIDKPAGMLVHPLPDSKDSDETAMKRLRDQLGQQVFPVHRLDRPTSGVLLFALDKKTAAIAQQAFERRNVLKIYHAVVCGITPEQWDCDLPLSVEANAKALEARTCFRRLAVSDGIDGGLSLLEAAPMTGRFHQIRRHLLYEGFPIVGDFRYAGMERSFELGEVLGTGTRMLLQAKMLELDHPVTGVTVRIEAPDDPDICKCFP